MALAGHLTGPSGRPCPGVARWARAGAATPTTTAEYQRAPGPGTPLGVTGATGTLCRVRIVLDASRCTGHGRCYSLAPELFDSDDEGHSVVLVPDVPDDLEQQARLAVDSCPEGCISLEG